MKKHFSKLTLAIILALVMGLAFAAPAMAGTEPLPQAQLYLSITKRITMDAGTALPDSTFDFRFTQVVPVDGTGTGAQFVPRATIAGDRPGVVTIPTQNISFPANLVPGNANTGQLGQNVNAGLNLGSFAWPHAGNFFFVIDEVPNTNAATIGADPNRSMTYDDTAWLLIVTVGNFVVDGNEVLRISGIQVAELDSTNAPVYTPGPGGTTGSWGPGYWIQGPKREDSYQQGVYTPGTDGQPGTWTLLPSDIAFNNLYVDSTPGNDTDPNNSRFAISKTVVGATRPQADLTTDFVFNATLTMGPTTVAAHNTNNNFQLPAMITAVVQERVVGTNNWIPVSPAQTVVFNINIVGTPPNATAITYAPADTFLLRDGQRLAFMDNVPAGTTVSVTEAAMVNWAPAASFTAGGTTTARSLPAWNLHMPADTQNVALTADSAALDPIGTVTSAPGTSMDFENIYRWQPIQGLFIGSMPFMVALFAATVLLAMMVASRSRQRIEQLPIAY